MARKVFCKVAYSCRFTQSVVDGNDEGRREEEERKAFYRATLCGPPCERQNAGRKD
jgi:hypothetical protein